jgi:hypothetical protein
MVFNCIVDRKNSSRVLPSLQNRLCLGQNKQKKYGFDLDLIWIFKNFLRIWIFTIFSKI